MDDSTDFPVSLVFSEQQSSGQNWDGWRGAAAHGSSASHRLPVVWSPTRSVVWKARVRGKGNSSPVIWQDRIILTTLVDTESGPELAVLCLDRSSGELRWWHSVGPPRGRAHEINGYASATPATDGQHIYFFFGANGLICLASITAFIQSCPFTGSNSNASKTSNPTGRCSSH